MSKTHSPSIFNGDPDNFYDPNFTLEINKRMTVPKSIRVNGDYADDELQGSGWTQAMPNEKFEMNVPDRILVVGLSDHVMWQEQHIGTKAPPREMMLENSVMPPEPGMTPPRILTLDDHYFPTVDEDEPNNFANSSIDSEATSRSRSRFVPETQIVRHVREQTPIYNALDVSLPPSEEIQHLRRQVGKLNRRVMAVELEMLQRQQRDKIFYAITITYFFLKAFSWLTRN
ncbi:transport and Golgi organization protein 11 isoform X2 [Venturia canescens]|uniref:transport and Golgi organization protein 11 isoform X2 n=1 Tax=Venturia canescens TaxID=32260 RepID=UPI001C9CE77B|nr:transport and Golgi organization protein 11 isoform X2 [Venturia canescens]